MTACRRWLLLVACVWVGGCAGTHPRSNAVDDAPVWGDEYEGVLLDTDPVDADFNAVRPSFAADAIVAPGGRTLRAVAAKGPLSVRARESTSGRAGAAAFDTGHLSVVVGAIRASMGEGAVLADARDASSLEPRTTRSLTGLRLAPSSSTWGSAPGAGIRFSASGVRVAAGAWHDRDDPRNARAFLSALVARGRNAVMVGTGVSRAGTHVFSLGAARASPAAFVSAEAGVAPDGARVVARVVAGEDAAWCALLVAGAPGTLDASPASAGTRWGGALQRRGRWHGASTRATLSTRSRRDGDTLKRRQRIECSSASLLHDGARVELGVRATRETSWVDADVTEGVPRTGTSDELRLRAALHASESVAGGTLRAEQTYRLEFVLAGAGPAGRVVAWTGRVRWRGIDVRVQASAFDLHGSQLAWAGRAGLPGAATFTTLSRTGVDLSASLRLSLGRKVRAGVQGLRTAAGEARFAVYAGAAIGPGGQAGR